MLRLLWMKIAKRPTATLRTTALRIAAALAPLRFQMQSERNGVMFVRPDETTAGLFERLECVEAGLPHRKQSPVLVLAVSLSVVQNMALQFRGLIERDGWPEVCTDPENGRVAFQRRVEIAAWLAQLVDRAPERFERLVREKQDTLLTRTREARERAGAVADTIVSQRTIAEALREPFAGLTEAETKLTKARGRFSFMVSPEDLQSVHAVAIAALIRSGDDAIAQTVSAPTPSDPIVRPMPVPDDLMWRIHLLMDQILIWRDES
jgi:hypothetical protein